MLRTSAQHDYAVLPQSHMGPNRESELLRGEQRQGAETRAQGPHPAHTFQVSWEAILDFFLILPQEAGEAGGKWGAKY